MIFNFWLFSALTWWHIDTHRPLLENREWAPLEEGWQPEGQESDPLSGLLGTCWRQDGQSDDGHVGQESSCGCEHFLLCPLLKCANTSPLAAFRSIWLKLEPMWFPWTCGWKHFVWKRRTYSGIIMHFSFLLGSYFSWKWTYDWECYRYLTTSHI